MSMMLALISMLLVAQGGFPAIDPAFFHGKWQTASRTGPRSLQLEAKGNKVAVTVDGIKGPLDGTAYLSTQGQPRTTVAITARTTDRFFVIRRDGDQVIVEMFSTLGDRPPLFWTERFTKAK
jgi:hypothetical protein